MQAREPDLLADIYCSVSELFFYVTQRVFAYAQEAIRRTKPDIVYVFNGRFATTAACIWACEQAGVKWLIHERGANKDKFALFTDYPQKVTIWANRVRDFCQGVDVNIMRIMAASFYQDRIRGTPRDYFSYTTKQKKGYLPEHLSNQPYVAYYVSSEDEVSCLGADQDLTIGWGEQREAFQTLKSHCQRLGQHLVIRVHPHLRFKSAEESRYWASQAGSGVEVLSAASLVCSYALMRNAKVVTTFMSSVGMEALHMGRPVMLLGRAYYHGLKGPYIPQTHEELRDFLMSPVPPSDLTDVWKWGYFNQCYGIDYQFYQPTGLFEGTFLGRSLWVKKEKSPNAVLAGE
jgi:hypothetical protein